MRRRLDPPTAQPQSVDIETRIEFVEDGELGLEHRHLQGLVALLLAAGKVDVERPVEKSRIEIDARCLGFEPRTHANWRVPGRDQSFGEHLLDRHAGHLGRVLHREEQPRMGTFVRGECQQVDAVERHRPSGDLVAGLAHQHVRQRRLSRAVRTHDRVNLARADHEIEAAQNGLVTHRGEQTRYDQLAHGAPIGFWSCARPVVVGLTAAPPSPDRPRSRRRRRASPEWPAT